jgi:hypothetical protein
MSIKFAEYWNLRSLLEEEFAQYLTREWIPGMNELGITILAVWNVVVGTCPTFISEGIADSIEQIEQALQDERHRGLNEGLLHFVDDYHSRVMTPVGLLPTLIGEPHHEAAKLNQLWDLVPEQEKALAAFLTEEFVPALEEMGLVTGGFWKTLIGPHPHQKLEGRADSLEQITSVLNDPEFLRLRGKLQNYVTNYESRVLKLKVVRVMGRTAVAYEYL